MGCPAGKRTLNNYLISIVFFFGQNLVCDPAVVQVDCECDLERLPPPVPFHPVEDPAGDEGVAHSGGVQGHLPHVLRLKAGSVKLHHNLKKHTQVFISFSPFYFLGGEIIAVWLFRLSANTAHSPLSSVAKSTYVPGWYGEYMLEERFSSFFLQNMGNG